MLGGLRKKARRTAGEVEEGEEDVVGVTKGGSGRMTMGFGKQVSDGGGVSHTRVSSMARAM